MLRLTGVAVLLAVGLSAGCRKAANEAMERVVEKTIESQLAKDGVKSDVDIGDKGVSFTFQGEQGKSTFVSGENVQLPAGFPKDVPLYGKLTLAIAHSQQENEMFAIQGTSPDTLDQIATFYQREAPKQGWKEDTSMDQRGELKALSYNKEGRMLQVILSVTNDGTSVNINTGKAN